jgi:sulfite exporter TauE/SafE
MTLMAAMGLGTAGPLLVLGLTGQVLSQRLRRWGNVLAGVVLVLLGAVTVLRALPAFHQLAGCPHGQAASCCESQPAAAPASCPHCQSQPTLQESPP